MIAAYVHFSVRVFSSGNERYDAYYTVPLHFDSLVQGAGQHVESPETQLTHAKVRYYTVPLHFDSLVQGAGQHVESPEIQLTHAKVRLSPFQRFRVRLPTRSSFRN